MNTNIKTMRRIRHTHSKFAALNATTLANEETEDGGAGGAPVAGPSGAGAFGVAEGVGGGESSTVALNAAADDEILNEKVDEKPWVMMVQGTGKGKGKAKEKLARVGGVEIGEQNAWGCMQWTNQKILEHVGFQGALFILGSTWFTDDVGARLEGTSQVALDVLAGVMSEYLSNVGRTIKYLCDKRPATMTAEVNIIHLVVGFRNMTKFLSRKLFYTRYSKAVHLRFRTWRDIFVTMWNDMRRG